MLLAVSTVAFPGVSLDALPGAVAAVGAEGLALNVSKSAALQPEAPNSIVKSFLTRCRAAGVKVSAVYGYAGRQLLAGGEAARDDIDLARRTIDIAALLQAPICRMFAGSERGAPEVIDRYADACRPAVEHAAAAGVKIGFPTHRDLAFDPPSCRRLIERLGRARAGIIFCGPNLELDGVAPLDALSQISDLIEQIELKDWRRRDGHVQPAPIGAGEATVWPLVEALGRTAFGGWVTLHHLRQHHPELPELDRDVSATVRRFARAAASRSEHAGL